MGKIEKQQTFRPSIDLPRSLLDSFGKLGEEEARNASKASIVILKHADSSLQNVSASDLPKDVEYIIRRLVAGLASPRQHAQEGFYTTLQAMLQLHPSTVDYTYEAINDKIAKASHLNKEEARGKLVGEVLAYGALIRAGQAHSRPKMRKQIIARLCHLRTVKSYLEIIAIQFLVHLLEKCCDGVVYMEVFDNVEKEIHQKVAKLSPSTLWLRLVLVRLQTHDPPTWLTGTLHPKKHHVIATTLMSTISELPKVHPLVGEVVACLAHPSCGGNKVLLDFWEQHLVPLLEKTSIKQMQLLFNIIQLILPRLRTAAEVQRLMSNSVVTLLMYSVSRHDQDLSTAARGLASALLHLVSSTQSSDIQLAVVKSLILPPGSLRFDHLTGTKLLSQMTHHFTLETIRGFAEIINSILEKKVEDVKPGDEKYAANTLKLLLQHPLLKGDEHKEWRQKQLVGLMKLALFNQLDTEDLREYMDAFIKVLNYNTGHIKEYSSILLHVVEAADRELKARRDGDSPRLTPRVQSWWDRVIVKLDKIQQDDAKDSIANQVFQILFCQMNLHLFIEPLTAKDIINELVACHRAVKRIEKKKAKKTTSSSSSRTEAENLQWVEVLTELLLSLMIQEKNIFRSVAQGVFWLLCPLVTPEALSLILDVLDPEKVQELIGKANKVEEEELEEEGGEEETDDDDDDDTDDESSDDSDSDSDDDDVEEDYEEDGEDEEEKEDKSGKMLVTDGLEPEEDMNLFDIRKQMLTIAGGAGADDIDIDSVPENELAALDEQLGDLFAAYQNKSKKNKKLKLRQDERSIMNFQSRCCDLLEVYMKECPKLTTILGLINPLLDAVRMADKDKRLEPLQIRLRTIVHQLGRVRKFSGESNISFSELEESVDEFFNMSLELPESLSAVVHDCYTLYFRIGRQLLGDVISSPDNPLVTMYARHMHTFFSKSSSVNVHTYMEPCTIDCSGLWKISEIMVKYAFDPSVKPFLRPQAIKVLQKLYMNKTFIAEKNEDHAIKVQQQTEASLEKILLGVCNAETFNRHLVLNIFSFLLVLHKIDSSIGGSSSLDWKKLGEAVLKVRQSISGKEMKRFREEYNKLRGALHLPAAVCNKQKQETSEDGAKTNKAGKSKAEKLAAKIKKKNKNKKVRFANSEDEEDGTEAPTEAPTGKKGKKKKKKEVQQPMKIAEAKKGRSKKRKIQEGPPTSSQESSSINTPAEPTQPKKKKKKKVPVVE